MSSTLLEATAIVVVSASPHQAMIKQQPGHRCVSELIAGRWAEDRRQAIHTRPFVITPIRNRHGRIERLVIAIDGTPARGVAMVRVKGGERAVRTGNESQVLTLRQTRLLQLFSLQVIAAAWSQVAKDSEVEL
jgi:hypothetical protein